MKIANETATSLSWGKSLFFAVLAFAAVAIWRLPLFAVVLALLPLSITASTFEARGRR